MRFVSRYPALFHVADREALDGIREHGLLSARLLCERHGAAGDHLLRHNRARWESVGPHALRRQGMSDRALRPRLDPAVACEDWRWFINGFVFLSPSVPLAMKLFRSEPDRDQIILRFTTACLLAAGVALRSCRFNNGFIDRAPPAAARRRRFDDYALVEDWSGEAVKEIVAEGCIPSHVGFAILSAS